MIAAVQINKMLNQAATRQVRTIRTQVRVLAPGRLAGDMAFNPSGRSLNVAADAAVPGSSNVGCGFVFAGDHSGSGSAIGVVGMGIPRRHVVAAVRETFTRPGRYTLTFTLNQRGRRILARLGAARRAYRTQNPDGTDPPTITWGVGLHFSTG
jgi:hypothetical protein